MVLVITDHAIQRNASAARVSKVTTARSPIVIVPRTASVAMVARATLLRNDASVLLVFSVTSVRPFASRAAVVLVASARTVESASTPWTQTRPRANAQMVSTVPAASISARAAAIRAMPTASVITVDGAA